MVNIQPFRGLRYNPEKFLDLSVIVTAPYDRIHEAEQARYYELSPYNFVRIIQGRGLPDDTLQNNTYTRARCYMQTWMAEEILIRDLEPALYVLEQHFTAPNGTKRTRRGLTAALELTNFDEGVILPHEHTLRGPKEDRLKLTQVTQTSWGHIFVLYPDADEINRLLQPFLDTHAPVVVRDGVVEPAVEQDFWVVNDQKIVSAVIQAMASFSHLIIADGHHRYETALTYRDQQRAAHPEAPPEAAFNYVLATLVSMSDPGLAILPTHRLIHSYTVLSGSALLKSIVPYFDIQPVATLDALRQAMSEATPTQPRFGFYDGNFRLLILKNLDVMDEILPDRAPHFRQLDVTVLHELVIERVMGLSKESILKRENITYLRDPTLGVAKVDRGEANFLFLLNPTRIEQVRACTLAGERMPQKSTDFFPKIISGLVALPLHDKLGH